MTSLAVCAPAVDLDRIDPGMRALRISVIDREVDAFHRVWIDFFPAPAVASLRVKFALFLQNGGRLDFDGVSQFSELLSELVTSLEADAALMTNEGVEVDEFLQMMTQNNGFVRRGPLKASAARDDVLDLLGPR